MKYLFMVTLVAGCMISLTSCSKKEESSENSGSSRSGYASVSDFKLPETTIATPAPWAPAPFDSKSGEVKPNDLSTFMESLVASGIKSKKGEFETTADYNKRIANIDAVFAPIKGSEIYALTGGPQYFEYNADKQEFKALSGMLCMEGYKFSKSTVSCDAGTVEAAERNATRESGMLKNVGTDYYLLFPTSRLKKYRQDPLYKFPETCPVPIEKAKDVSKKLRIAYAFRITKAEVATGDGRYVEPTSLLQYYDAVGIFVNPEYFICYDKMNGQVLYQKKL
ncbi:MULTISPECIES: hypothetical protein [unclassified Pseudomonas]|uniref:hypothetical protein n=1 Tax=unclassified Pseudomonas TaxID=196821 RepID=UPI00224AB988|nr:MULTISPECIES: hypothetical protein [unclassified Pseudomonas]MCX2814573.1 hypothetical protein [Pseudomonas sp. DCB_E]MCX9143946.1 hypothetical protein [Pseudomonas sp. DCB_Q]